jgi:hypothetical protein
MSHPSARPQRISVSADHLEKIPIPARLSLATEGHRINSQDLTTSLGRPKSGPLSRFSQEMRDSIKEWRELHTGWGADTLRIELARDKRFVDLPLPSRPRISAFLKSENLVRPYAHHTKLSMPPPKIVTECHEEWELDAQGACLVPGIGLVSLLNFGDL